MAAFENEAESDKVGRISESENLPDVIATESGNAGRIIHPADKVLSDAARQLEEFITALNENSVSGSIVKDLGKLLNEVLEAEYPKYDKNNDLVCVIPDYQSRVKGVELILKCLKILNAEPTAVFNGPVMIKWKD